MTSAILNEYAAYSRSLSRVVQMAVEATLVMEVTVDFEEAGMPLREEAYSFLRE